MTHDIIHRSIAALALLAAIAFPAAALLAPEPGDPLEAGGASHRACVAAVERQSPEEAAQHASQAEAAYGRALDTRPTEARMGIARTLLDCRIADAPMMEKVTLLQRIEEHLGAVIEETPYHPEARFLYGALLYNVPPFLGRTEEAIEHFEVLLSTSPDDRPAPAESYASLGDLYERQERPEDTMRVWREGATRHPESESLRERVRAAPTGGAGHPPDEPHFESGPPPPSAAVDGRIREILEAEVAREAVPGLAAGIARAGEIVLLDGFGLADLENRVPMTADSVVRIGSVSKQFTAVIALRLHEEGVLRVDDSVDRWLPAESHEPLAGITIHHLLTHTAGLPRDPAEGPDWIQESLVLPRVGAPGERYEYSNLGYALLGRALESVADRSFEHLLDRFVMDPAGLETTRICDERAIVPNRARGYTWRGDRLLNDDPVRGSPTLLYAGSLCSTARDLLRWQRALHGGRILGDDAYAVLTTPPPVADPAGTTYAAGLRVHAPEGRRVFHHSGGITGFLSEVAHYPEEDLSIVVLTNSEASDPRGLGYRIAELAGASPVR